jgi:hypothetical protein
VFACLYSAANFFMDRRLRKKDLPTDTAAYAGKEPVERDPGLPFGGPDPE